jgi:hemerythrin-like domain-containing protein
LSDEKGMCEMNTRYVVRELEGLIKELDFINSKSENDVIEYLHYTNGIKHYPNAEQFISNSTFKSVMVDRLETRVSELENKLCMPTFNQSEGICE